MTRSFKLLHSVALAALCVAGCNSDQTSTPPAGGAMEPGKMEPSNKMEPGKMEPSNKMEPGKMEPGKMNP